MLAANVDSEAGSALLEPFESLSIVHAEDEEIEYSCDRVVTRDPLEHRATLAFIHQDRLH